MEIISIPHRSSNSRPLIIIITLIIPLLTRILIIPRRRITTRNT